MNPDQEARDMIRKRLTLPPEKKPDLQELRRKQWSKEFESLMRNRLVMGALRYETIEEKRHSTKPPYSLVESAIQRLQDYLVTGNSENLVDAANLCLLEFEVPSSHPSPKFIPTDDNKNHVKRKS